MTDNVKLLPPSAFQASSNSTVPRIEQNFGYGTQPSQNFFPRDATSSVQTNASHSAFKGAPSPQLYGPAQLLSPSQVENLISEHEKRETQLSAQLHVLQEQLNSRSAAYKVQIEKLEEELQTAKGKHQRSDIERSRLIEDLQSQLKERTAHVEQLKNYIAEQSTPSTQMCKKQLDTMQERVNSLEKEKRDLESSVELLNIRLKSHDHIQNIHDSEVSKAGEVTQEKKKQILLKRWRTKVYELLVQIQSSEIIHKKDQQMQMQKMSDILRDCDCQKQEVMKLQHALADRQATLDMQMQLNKKLENELQSAENLALDLDNRNKGYQQTISSLVDFTNGLHEAFAAKEEKYKKMSHALQLFNQRITFASGRIELLQNQLARKDALKRVDLIEQKERTEPSEQDGAMIEDLQQELSRLARERDSLAKQSKEDVLSIEHKLAETRQSHEIQLQEVQEQNRDLQEKLRLQAVELASALETVEMREKETRETRQAMSQLETRMEHMQNNIQQEVDAAYDRDQEKHRQELAELQQKVSDSNREHSKTVVALRQLERQMGRERERMNEQIKASDEFYKQHIAKLEKNVRELEKERNLLMTTLRQEGLVGKHRAARATPITDTLDREVQATDTEASVELLRHNQDNIVEPPRTDITTEELSDLMSHQQEGSTFEQPHDDVTVSHDLEQITELHPQSDAEERPPQPLDTLASGRDTYFEETGESQPVKDEELADVIEEVKKLSAEVMDESFLQDSNHSDDSD